MNFHVTGPAARRPYRFICLMGFIVSLFFRFLRCITFLPCKEGRLSNSVMCFYVSKNPSARNFARRIIMFTYTTFDGNPLTSAEVAGALPPRYYQHGLIAVADSGDNIRSEEH